MAQRNIDRLRPIYEQWAHGNFRRGPELYSSDIKFTTFTAEGDTLSYRGRDALLDWYRDFLANWKNFRREAHDFLEGDDKVLVIGRQYAEGKGSGVPVEMPVYDVWTFKDDQVVELHITRDRATAFAAAGVREQDVANRRPNNLGCA